MGWDGVGVGLDWETAWEVKAGSLELTPEKRQENGQFGGTFVRSAKKNGHFRRWREYFESQAKSGCTGLT